MDTMNRQTLFMKLGSEARSLIVDGDMSFNLRQRLAQVTRADKGDLVPHRLIRIMDGYGYKKKHYTNKRVGIEGFEACNKILGLPENKPATVKEIESAFRRSMLECHPDKVSQAAPEEAQKAADRYHEISKAKDRLLHGHKSGKDKGAVTVFEDSAKRRPPIHYRGNIEDLPPPLVCHILVNYVYGPTSRAQGKQKLKRDYKRLQETEDKLEQVKAQRRALAVEEEVAQARQLSEFEFDASVAGVGPMAGFG